METTYRLKANELSTDLLKAIKDTYHDREIEITITEVADETEFLLSADANREHLLAALDDIGDSRNLVNVLVESFEE